MGKNKRKSKRQSEGIVGKVFLLCLLLIIVGNLIYPDREKSEQENRMLAKRPKLTVDGLLSGNFMEQYEDYQSDQFMGRDGWRGLKVALNRFGGSKEENDVLLGKSKQLLEKINKPEKENLDKNLEAIQNFAGRYKDVPVSMLIVPDAAAVLTDKLPSFATVPDQSTSINFVKKELGDSVKWIDATKVLNKHKDEKLYYKTDHHWTTLGASYVFAEAAGTMGINGGSTAVYASYPVATDFNGTLAAKSGSRLDVKEEIDVYIPKDLDNDVIVSYVNEQKKTTTLYDLDKLKTRDKYGVFLGDNTSLIDIKTVSESKKRLLVVKDSYANCFIPFLTPYYREIVVLDPRYFSGDVKDVMETYNVSDVLFLYSGNTFLQDNNISGVLNGE